MTIGVSSAVTPTALRICGWLVVLKSAVILPPGGVTSKVGNTHVVFAEPPAELAAVIVKCNGIPGYSDWNIDACTLGLTMLRKYVRIWKFNTIYGIYPCSVNKSVNIT